MFRSFGETVLMVSLNISFFHREIGVVFPKSALLSLLIWSTGRVWSDPVTSYLSQ